MARIAILHEVLGRSKGGIEAWIYHASEELLRQGHEVTIFNTMANIPEDAAPLGIKIVSLPRKAVSPSVFFIRSVINYRKFLKGKIELFDAVWARSFGMAWAASHILPFEKTIYINAAPYSFYAYRPFIQCLKQDPGVIGFFKTISSQLSYIVAWFFEKSAIKNSIDVYLSKERKRQTLSFFQINEVAGKFHVIPAGVNIVRFHPSTQNWDGETDLRIITVCRLSKDKNIQCILNALSILKTIKKPIHLTIVGEGEYENELKVLAKVLNIQDIVSFVGRKEDIEKWYRENHLFVLPSLYEGFGSVYVEAMASGLPCIAISSYSGEFSVAADEIIDHNKNGFLMKENDPKELANYVLNFLNSPDKLNTFSYNARIKANLCFSWENTIHHLLNISTTKNH